MVIAIRRAGVNGAADFPRMSRFRLKRTGLILAGMAAGGALVWFFFFPVPVGGLLRFAAARAGAAGPGGTLLLEGATFRWRWGEPDLRLEIAGLALRRGAEPLADVGRVTVEVGKRAWWSSGYEPARIALAGARVSLDLRTAAAPPPRSAAPVAAVGREQETPAARVEAALAPLAGFWRRDGAATVIDAAGLVAAVRTADGIAEWRWKTVLARAARAGTGLDFALDLAVEGEGAPRAEVRVRHLPDTRRLTATLTIPRFDTAALPPWPGAAERPVRASVEANFEAELDLGAGKVIRGAIAASATDAVLTLPDLAGPIPVPRAALRARAAGDPLRIDVDEARLDISGARVFAEGVSAVLGAAPRLEGAAALENVSAAAWVALLPVELRKRLPVDVAAVAELWLRRATIKGRVDLRTPRDGTWNPRALQAEGEIVATNAGRDLTATWQATQGDDGVTTVRTALVPVDLAAWGGALTKGSVGAALAFPFAAQAEAMLEPSGEVRSAAVDVSAGPGRVGAWGPLPQPVEIKQVALRAELAEAGRRVRVPHLRIETDGPLVEVSEFDAAWPQGRPIMVRGRGVLRSLDAGWIEPRLAKGLLAPLRDFGLEAKDVGVSEATVRWDAELVEAADGATKPAAFTATVDATLGVSRVPVPVRLKAQWLPANERAEIELGVGPLQPALLPVTLPAGMPPLTHFAIPMEVRGSALIGLDGAVSRVRFGVEGGPGVVRALPAWPVDVPIAAIRAAGEVAVDGSRARVESLHLEAGGGLTLSGRDLVWNAAAAPTISGELRVGPMGLAGAFALLPAEVGRQARPWLQAAEFGGAHLRVAATPDEKAPHGWRIAELRGEATLAGLRATVPGAGELGAGRVDLQIDHPRLRAVLGDATVPAFYRGSADVTAEVDATRPEALRATVRVEGGEVRLVPPEFAAVRLLEAPLQLTAVQTGSRAAEFALESARVLGRRLRLEARAESTAAGGQSVEIGRLEFGATSLGIGVREEPGQARTIRMRGAHVAVDELLQTAAPFLPAMGGAPAGKPIDAAPARERSTIPGKSDPGGTMEVGVDLETLALGAGRTLKAVRATARLRDGWPERLEVAAQEGAGNALLFSLGAGTSGGAQAVRLTIDDASAWVAAMTTPFKAVALPAEMAATVATVAQVPTLVAGGRVDLAGEWAERARFSGRLGVGRATMVQPPRILQLLALKSGKALTQRPLLEQLTIERVAVDAAGIALDGVTLAGTGLVDRLKLNSARYELRTQNVAVDGLYFGVGFEVVGTRADPQVFLKDNSLLVRTVGQRNEFDFEAMARDAEEAKAKAKAAGQKP